MFSLANLRDSLNETQALQAFQLLRYGSAILVGILLAKSNLSQEDIGNYEYLLYVGMVLSFFWVNALTTSLISLFPKLSLSEQPTLIFQAFVLYTGLGCVFCLTLYLGSGWLIPFLTKQSDIPFLNWYLLALFFNFPTHLIDIFYLLKKQAWNIIAYGLFTFGGNVIVLTLPVFLGWGIGFGIKGITFLAGIRFIWILFLSLKKVNISWSGILLNRYLALTVPLVGYAFMGGFAPVFDNWLVSWYFQEEHIFAVYRYGARELPLALALTAGLSTSLIPVLSKNLGAGLVNLKEKSRRLYHWLFPLSIVLILLSDWLFPIVFNPDFAESSDVFKVYLLLVLSRVLLPTTVMYALEETKVIFVISVLELLLNVVLSVLLIPVWGLVGVAFATVLAFLFEKVAMIVYLYRVHNLAPKEYMDGKWITVYGLLLVISLYFSS